MTSLHKQDLLGLALIALVAAVIGHFTSGQLGFMVWAGASTSVTVSEFFSRRRQRKAIPELEALTAQVLESTRKLQAHTADLTVTSALAANVLAAEKLQTSLGEARKRLA